MYTSHAELVWAQLSCSLPAMYVCV